MQGLNLSYREDWLTDFSRDDIAFEKQSALFALAVSDVVLINMWCHVIGREQAANKPLLKTVFQVMMCCLMMCLFMLFVVRDKTRTLLENWNLFLGKIFQRNTTFVNCIKRQGLGIFFSIQQYWSEGILNRQWLY